MTMCIVSCLLLLLSCENNAIIEKSMEIENMEASAKLKKDILSFNSESEFNSALENLILKKEDDLNKGISTRSTVTENYHSLYDEFNEAMEVAESYYDREGGYEEFKLRFPNLYYPEYDNDYSAYLPVSNEDIAKLLNNKGEVIIGKIKRNMIDIYSYEQLEQLGLTFPENDKIDPIETPIDEKDYYPIPPTTPPTPDLHWVSLGERIYNSSGNRRFKINRTSVTNFPTANYLEIRLEIVFRKKGFLGAWYNYSGEGVMGTGARERNDYVPAKGTPGFEYKSGNSPLRFQYNGVFPDGAPYYDLVSSVWFRGHGEWVCFNALEGRR